MSIYARIQHKRDTSANWNSKNPVLLNGEIILVDTAAGDVRVKVGDGTKTYKQLPFVDESILNDISSLSDEIDTNYGETIIGLEVDGTTVTYIKGDGSRHTFETQDTNTTYSLGTDTVTGLTRLYATTGSAEDGTMTQKAIKTELDKKVGVSIDTANNRLVFTK